MKSYEVTFIVDPVLSGDEIKSAAKTYQDMLTKEKCSLVHVEDMGLRQLTYPINKRSSGVYYCVEFETPDGNIIPKIELAFRRDERIMRFLTVKLDKYGVKYNSDKRNGLIGTRKPVEEEVVPKVESEPVKSSEPKTVAKSVASAKVEKPITTVTEEE